MNTDEISRFLEFLKEMYPMTDEVRAVLARPPPPPAPRPRPIERYVGATVSLVSGAIEVGLQYFDLELPSQLRSKLRELTMVSVSLFGQLELNEDIADAITKDLDARIIGMWGNDRGRFIEVWKGTGTAEERLIQTYAPCGMPRDR